MTISGQTALIVGSKGQDGQVMRALLANKGFACIEIERNNFDICNYDCVSTEIENSKPDFLFYFAAHHTSATEKQVAEQNRGYFDINTIGLLNFLDAIKNSGTATRVFYASSSLIFQPNECKSLQENSPLSLNDLYTISKYASMKLCDYYRETFGLNTTVGIMFNHESRYRKSKFVSKKIVEYVVALNNGYDGKLSLGNLETVVDWGAAEDYMEAAYRLLKSGKTGDYIISSGKGHTLRQFCEIAFSYVGLNYADHLIVGSEGIARVNHTRIGDNTKLITDTGWMQQVSFEKMIHNMIDYQMNEQL